MSKLEKRINSKNNAFILSNLKLKQTNKHSKSTTNKNNSNAKIKFILKSKNNKNNTILSKIIIDFFLKIKDLDNSIEKIRTKLFSFQDFSSKKIFKFLDKNSNNFLTLSDFKKFLKDNSISFSEKNLRKFIHNFDKNNDFCINYDEFLGIISPKKTDINPNNNSDGGDLNNEIQKIFCQLINEELKFIDKYFELTENINKFKKFSIYEAFKEIVDEQKYIDIENLKNFFIKKGIKLDEKEIKQLMFRIDKDNDGLVSYEEFKEILSPLNNTEIINNTNRDYNKDFFYQYDIDDEKDDSKVNEDNLNINITNENQKGKKNSKKNISTKREIYLNLQGNKENEKNYININKAEERYNYNFETDLENVKNKKRNKNNRNFISNTDIENNLSNSIYLYKDNMKNTKTDIENNIKEYNRNKMRAKLKGVNNYNYYTHSHSNNNLVEQTKSVLGISHNNILSKIKVNSGFNGINKKNNNLNMKKKIIEVEYENNYKMETPQRNNKNRFFKKEKLNKNNSELISDSLLNYDYSRYTNKDRKNGSYYFKQKNKSETTESINSTNNISDISNEENNIDKNVIIMRNNNKIKNTNKRNSFNLQYNCDNLFSFKDENNSNIKDKNYEGSNLEKLNKTFKQEHFNNNSNLNFNYNKKNNIKQSSINNDTNSNNFNNQNSQQYLDSLENLTQDKMEEPQLNLKNIKNQYHYNIRLTRNITKNKIQSQMLNKNKTNNYYSSINKRNINNNNFGKDNQNKSCIMPSLIDKNNLFNFEQGNENQKINNNIYNSNFNKVLGINCISNRCPKCKCFQSESKDFDNDGENENIFNIDENNKYDYIKNNHSYSSLPKNFHINKKNNLNLEYSMDNVNKNKNNHRIVYNRNDFQNKLNPYYTNKQKVITIYRNSNKINHKFNTNNSCYYLESSYNNNNFKINQIKSKVPQSGKNNDNINYNRFTNSNKFSDLYSLFLDFIKQDSIIESLRQLLSDKEDANLMDIFSLFDYSGNRLISASDFIKTLKQLGIIINKEELIFLFRKFNKKLNDYFDFDEFCEIILPKKHSNEKIMDNRAMHNYYYDMEIGNYQNNNFFNGISIETKKMLGSLFKNIIEGEKSNENYRKILAQNVEISGFDLFNKIKKNYSIGIYKEDIANFMKKNKYKLDNKEIELLMNRFDKNKNGMIDYKEFIIEISPISKQLFK